MKRMGKSGLVRKWLCQSLKVETVSCAFVFVVLGVSGCLLSGSFDRRATGTSSHVSRAKKFESLVRRGEYETAQEMMVPDARRWWENREGGGQAWRIGPSNPGPWANWDRHFRSEKELVTWKDGDHSATTVIRETNDYFRLLDRGWVTSEITYFFDDAGKIEGLLIRAVGDRTPGRTDEFLAWAKAHDPGELEALMPSGEIDPSGDHPKRLRRLLNRWRQATGLEPIE